MAFSTEHPEGESIVVFTFHPPMLLIDDYDSMIHESLALIAAGHNPLYRVVDLRSALLEFDQLVQWLGMDTQQQFGSAMDVRIKPIYIGDDDETSQFVQWLRRIDVTEDIPIFPTVTEAVDYARARIAETN